MDTISFRIKENFKVTERANFNTEFSRRTFSELSENERIKSKDPKTPYLRKFVLKPPKNDEDIHWPSVEIYEKANSALGKVEYEMVVTVHSLPKLIFGNSVQEIQANDKEKIVLRICKRLWEAGINLSEGLVKIASVSVVHFCKNIVLPKDIALRGILADLSHTDMGKAYDTTEDVRRQRDKNGSRVIHLYCGTREWCFYDKAEDARQTRGRREDKTRTIYEKDLFSSSPFQNTEIFRYEYRLNKAQTIRSELHSLLNKEYADGINFEDLFTDGLWKTVLIKSWKNILRRPENQLALLGFDDPLQLMLHIFKKAKESDTSAHSQNKALWSCALALLIKFCGAKTVKSELNRIWANKDDRLTEKLAVATDLVNNIPPSKGVLYITEELEKFELINLASLEKGL